MTSTIQHAHDTLLEEARAIRAEEQRLIEKGQRKEARTLDAAALAIEGARRQVRAIITNPAQVANYR